MSDVSFSGVSSSNRMLILRAALLLMVLLPTHPGSSQARVDVPKPAAGFTAFLGGGRTHRAPTGHTYKLSTQVQVTPDWVNRWP